VLVLRQQQTQQMLLLKLMLAMLRALQSVVLELATREVTIEGTATVIVVDGREVRRLPCPPLRRLLHAADVGALA
jgi:hypothetical protein